MLTYTRQLFIVICILGAGTIARAQCPVMPVGFLCITQAAGNVAAENKRELDATKAKVIVLEGSLIEKDKSIADVQAAATKNKAELEDRIHKTEAELASTKGQLIKSEANETKLWGFVEFLAKGQKKKCMPFSILCL